jgi:predicted metal-dependent phosphoesterase TrpH
LERGNLQLKIDLHIHSCYSNDSVITPKELIFYAKKHGLDAIAVTDHDRIDGALKIAKEKDFLIIPGIEVSSLNGHIIGLNIREVIPAKLGSDETVDRIHEAGGIAVACHPMTFFKGSLGKHTNSKFDAVEVINASAFPFRYSVYRGEKLALQLGKAQTAGSDAHYGPEIGCAYTLVEAELEFEDVVKALTKGLCKPFGRAIPLRIRLEREVFSLKKKIELSKIF